MNSKQMNLENQIEAILFFKNEPVSVSELIKLVGGKLEEVKVALANLREFYKDRGVVVVSDGEFMSFGTHPDASKLIENLQKEELSRELGRASLEVLAIILYKGPISRREIDHIRGVNSGFILRTLMIRGLIERAESIERSYSYKATLKLLEYLGVTRRENLPEYQTAFKKIEEFEKTSPTDPSTRSTSSGSSRAGSRDDKLGVNQNG
ncbi:MAG: SMC-Scp complex subunit ScpB [bacterium]|nr:SMC-Scp complex subunit ScpB [bacterium]MDZ4205716.1 SMC-Scp complex subunit ScpB [Patescibacteria group bacterium]